VFPQLAGGKARPDRPISFSGPSLGAAFRRGLLAGGVTERWRHGEMNRAAKLLPEPSGKMAGLW